MRKNLTLDECVQMVADNFLRLENDSNEIVLYNYHDVSNNFRNRYKRELVIALKCKIELPEFRGNNIPPVRYGDYNEGFCVDLNNVYIRCGMGR